MNFTHSSRKSWTLIRRIGAAQQLPKSTHLSVSANAIAAYLIQAAKALHDKKFEWQVCMQGRTLLQQIADKSLPYPFTEEEISAALQKTKPATVPGYDNIHVEFVKNLGPKARSWLSKFFSRIMATHSIPKIWRKAKVITVEKPGKDPSLAANYHPISLLSVCYKLLERLALQRISLTVEGLLSPDQAGFSKGQSTCDQVAALTTFIENGFHLHNTSVTRELSVYLDGQRLRHECHPTYLGVTLDHTLSYREHLMKTAGRQLKNRNNLLMKLPGSTWGTSANTAVIYSGALLFSSKGTL